MALRLRYGDKSLLLSSGQIFVGRSAECQVTVSDPLASRRHAAVTMSKAGAFVSDLQSRAGVLVNGEPVAGARKLARGDVIQIASLRLVVDELTLETDEEEPTDPRLRSTIMPPSAGVPGPGRMRLAPTPAFGIPRVMARADAPPLSMEPQAAPNPARAHARATQETIADTSDLEEDLFTRTLEAPRVSVPMDPPRDQQAPSTREAPASSSRDVPPSGREGVAARGPGSESTLRAVAVLAEKALALGRAEEAERILQRALTEALEAARRNELDGATLELAASLAARLATATSSGRWFDALVGVYSARAEMLPAAVIDLLFAALHKVKTIDKARFREYVTAMKTAPGDSPARRFLIQRLEGLRRLADLK